MDKKCPKLTRLKQTQNYFNMEIISTSKQKARKKHICNFCELPIEIGTIYERQVCKDSDIYTWKSHIYCSEIAHKLKMFDGVWNDGLTANDFKECITQEYKSLIILTDESFSILPPFKNQLEYVITHYLKI